MSEKHEVVIIGGGHNGLTVASNTAKDGVNGCIAEEKRLSVDSGPSSGKNLMHQIGINLQT